MTLQVAVVAENAYTVDLFPTGPAALCHRRAADVLPDVLLLDLNLPGLSGFEVLTGLKADPRLAQNPVVMFTASSASGDVAEADDLHASASVMKAPSFQAFLGQVERS